MIRNLPEITDELNVKIYSYVITHDTGFAPNPFWGYCTLATCKPLIRRKAKVGDWVIGTGPKKTVGTNRLVYAMKVTEVLHLENYWDDERFQDKKPGKQRRRSVGDNIYHRDKKGVMQQYFPSKHSYLDKENSVKKKHDLKGENVLISGPGTFYYFGRNAPAFPESLMCLIKKGPNHKCNFPQDVVKNFLQWIMTKKSGINGSPWDYSSNQKSC